jgi:hypothetical protein
MPKQKLLKICYDRVLEGDALIEARRLAVEENLANAIIPAGGLPGVGSDITGVALKRCLWKPGRILRARFLDGDPRVQAKVITVAKEWEKYANIKYEFGQDPNAEIRISFIADSGSWSFCGTDCLTIPMNKPTMNLGWLQVNTANEEYNRVVIHEFGHSLGLAHEHQNPATNIPWNKPAVYRAYAGPPNNWTPDKVDANLFQTYAVDQTQYTEFDRQSIMLYPIPKELTDGAFEVGWNTRLSDIDKSFITSLYPWDATPIVNLTIGAAPTEANINTPAAEDVFRFIVVTAGSYVIETAGISDLYMELSGPDDLTRKIISDDDSGPGLNPRIEAVLQPGAYYARLRHYRKSGTGAYSITVKHS